MTARTPLAIGVLGAGHGHARGYSACLASHQGIEFIGVYDENRSRAEHVASPHGVPVHDDPESLLSKADAVIVATQNTLAPALVERAASAGKPVLCEKPLGATRADGDRMIEACRRAGVPLAVALSVRYVPAITRLRELVRAGVLGNTISVWATNHGAYPGGWFGDPRLSGGGCLVDHVVHVADLLRFVWGADFTSVRAEAATRHQPGLVVEDAGLVLATMSNGVAVSLDSSWSRHRDMAGAVDVTMTIVAEAAVVTVDAFAERITLHRRDGTVAYTGLAQGTDGPLIDGWVDALRSGGPVPIPGEDGYRASELSWAALESARTHRAVNLPLPELGASNGQRRPE